MKELMPTDVKKKAGELELPVHTVSDRNELMAIASGHKKAVFLVADFGLIIPPSVLALPDKGFWNIHPSLLPKYRGTTPIQSAILNDEKVTGVSIIKIDEQVDHGPLLVQREVPLGINDTYLTLLDKLARLGAELANELLLNPRSKILNPKHQDHSQATLTKKLTKEDGFVQLEKLAFNLEPLFRKYNLMHLLPNKDLWRSGIGDLKLHNMIRALNPWPGVWSILPNNKIIKLTSGRFDPHNRFTLDEVKIEGKVYKNRLQ